MFFYTCVVKFFYKVNFYCLRTIFRSWLTKNEKFINQMKNIFRSSHPAVCCKKGSLKNVTKFTRKICARASFLIKLKALGLKFYLKSPWHSCFPVDSVNLLRTPNLFYRTPLVAASVYYFLVEWKTELINYVAIVFSQKLQNIQKQSHGGAL